MTENEFITRFRPEQNPDGSYYRQRDWTDATDWALVQRAHEERRVWTHVNDGAGNGGVVPGLAFVNREFYVICAVPIGDQDDVDVVDEDDLDFCTVCGERFADTLPIGEPEVVTRSTTSAELCVSCAM